MVEISMRLYGKAAGSAGQDGKQKEEAEEGDSDEEEVSRHMLSSGDFLGWRWDWVERAMGIEPT